MARTSTTKKTVEDLKEKEPKKVTTTIKEKDEVVELKDKLKKTESEKDEILNLVKTLQKEIETMKSQSNTVTITQNENLSRTVKVICLMGYTFNLSTKPLGSGKLYTFNKYGESKNIKFTDMQEILELYKQDFESGRVILANKKDYVDLQIEHIYDNVLTKEEMNKVIALEDKEAIDIILDMDLDMQESVCAIIAEKIANGESYDYNKIKVLEDNGLKISTLADEIKNNLDSEK